MTASESSAKLAERYKVALEAARQQVAPVEQPLRERIAAAQQAVEALLRAEGAWIEFEFAWLGEANWSLKDSYVSEQGVYLTYKNEQGYEDDGFLPFAFLDDFAVICGIAQAGLIAARQQAEIEARERKRSQLLAQLAELDKEA